jgi:hypothetical protein
LGYDSQLKGLITNCSNKSVKKTPLEKDPVPEIQQLKIKWSENIIRAFRNVTSKFKKDENDEEEDESVNYVYDAMGILDFMGDLKPKSSPLSLKIRQLEIYIFPYEVVRVPKYSEIKTKF